MLTIRKINTREYDVYSDEKRVGIWLGNKPEIEALVEARNAELRRIDIAEEASNQVELPVETTVETPVTTQTQGEQNDEN